MSKNMKVKDTIEKVDSWETRQKTLMIDCLTRSENIVKFRVKDFGDGVLRFTIGNTDYDKKFPIAKLSDDMEGLPLELIEKENALRLETASLKVEITKDPFRFCVLDRKKHDREIWAQMEDDLNVGGQRLVEPLSLHRENGSVRAISDSYSLANDEKIFGFGEKFTAFNKVGQRINSWVTDAHGTGTKQSYMEAPFFLSSLGYGIFFNTTAEMVHEVGFPEVSSGTYRVELKDARMDYFLFYGPEPKEILRKYTALTGRPEVPPAWTFGLWMSRCFYDDGEELLEVAQRLREEGIPCDVMNFDARTWLKPGHQTNFEWDPDRYNNPESLMEELDELGFKSCFWENPYVSDKTELFQEGKDSGYFLTDENGDVIKIKWIPEEYEDFPSTEPSGIVDFTNQDAREWWKKQHERLIQIGADAFKTDFGDMVPKRSNSKAGIKGDMLHNLYPILFVKTVFEALEDQGKEGVVWDRPGWSGIQKYPIKWGGDPQTTFRAMAQSLRGGLSAGLSGISFWSHDIGGFYGDKPDPRLYIRWAQFGLLSSHARCHGTTPREPWEFGDEALKIFKKFNELRYRLLPYIYSEAHKAAELGLPLMRPLLLEYPDEPQAYYADLQYLLGRDILVAPVFNREDRREVYLPNELWYDYWEDKEYKGEQSLESEVPLDEIPLFIRAGSIIPLAEVQERIGNEMVKPNHVNIYLGRDSSRDVVNDNGKVRFEVNESKEEILFQTEVLEGNPLQDRINLEFLHLPWKPNQVTCVGEGKDQREMNWDYEKDRNALLVRAKTSSSAEVRINK
ncbi:alpha-xylosidase [Candidatus Bipolaricaulota bacterium]|nr:alpha-xylosidase [Candidatus Bipolaricaulota bacterium]